jgi:hypothetical protein
VTRIKNGQHFASAKETTKLVRPIANLVRRARLDYEGFRRVYACRSDLPARLCN